MSSLDANNISSDPSLFLPEYHSVQNLLNGFLVDRTSMQEEGAQLE